MESSSIVSAAPLSDEQELYVYDPAAGITTKVARADFADIGEDTKSQDLHALDGKLYFNGFDGREYELYVYDPDTGTTAKVDRADIRNGSSGTDPEQLHALDGKLYFRGSDGSRGSDG